MNRIAVAQELVRIAELLVAMPLWRGDIIVENRLEITTMLRNECGLEGLAARANPVYSELLTNVSDPNKGGPDNNKFLYFAIYKDQSGEFVGGNCWGRIGYTPKGAVVVSRSPDFRVVEQKVLSKQSQKVREGYKIDRFAA